MSPLTAAAEGGHAAVVRLLLDAGADPNYRRTALFPLAAAATRGDLAMVRALLDAGAAVDGRDEDGGTALSDAAAAGHVEVVRVLLDAGADPKRKDYSGQTALSIAADNERPAVVDLLLPLSSASERRRVKLAGDAEAQAVDPADVRKFYRAAAAGDRRTVEAMLAAGMPVDARDGDGMTALMGAANRGHLDLVRFLLDRGANVDHTDRYGETPLSTSSADFATFNFLYPLSSAKSRKKGEKQVRLQQKLAPQYPEWQGWEPPQESPSGKPKPGRGAGGKG